MINARRLPGAAKPAKSRVCNARPDLRPVEWGGMPRRRGDKPHITKHLRTMTKGNRELGQFEKLIQYRYQRLAIRCVGPPPRAIFRVVGMESRAFRQTSSRQR